MSNSLHVHSLHVLVVDDSAVVRQTIRALLDMHDGIETRVAHDPLIAMEKMKQERPDVIILDLEMPRMDGLTFLRKIMDEDPLPVIVCSGHVGDASALAIRALEAGAVELLAKPKVGVQAFLEESAVLLADSVRAATLCKPALRARGRGNARVAASAARSPVAHGIASAIIAMGASTGGTEALREILERRTPPFAAGVVHSRHKPSRVPTRRRLGASAPEVAVRDCRAPSGSIRAHAPLVHRENGAAYGRGRWCWRALTCRWAGDISPTFVDASVYPA